LRIFDCGLQIADWRKGGREEAFTTKVTRVPTAHLYLRYRRRQCRPRNTRVPAAQCRRRELKSIQIKFICVHACTCCRYKCPW
jgi:hypothetical protein